MPYVLFGNMLGLLGNMFCSSILTDVFTRAISKRYQTGILTFFRANNLLTKSLESLDFILVHTCNFKFFRSTVTSGSFFKT